MAEERKVSPCQESKALSWPMRVEAPAARITPANDGAKRIEERYYKSREQGTGNREQQRQNPLNHTFDYAQCKLRTQRTRRGQGTGNRKSRRQESGARRQKNRKVLP